MKLILHAGLDKCGSTAIQAHLHIHRDWFLCHGVYIPQHGLTGFGHYPLFRNMTREYWSPLLEELGSAKRFEWGLISFEGIHFLRQQQLQFLAEQLSDHKLRFLFYLRDQAEIIQSGYLQKLKRRKQAISMSDFRQNLDLCTPESRDYRKLLTRFEQIFPAASIQVRPYNLKLFKEGDIVPDFLEFLGCDTTMECLQTERFPNPSLDIEAAELLNIYDSLTDDALGRKELVEDLLMLVAQSPARSRCFLDKRAVQHIQQHYAASNRWLLARFNVDLTACRGGMHRAVAKDAAAMVSDYTPYVTTLAELAGFPRWGGERLQGSSLHRLLGQAQGWSKPLAEGAWSLGTSSRISFRIPWSKLEQLEAGLQIVFCGHYFAENHTTELWANGMLVADLDLSDTIVTLPKDIPAWDGVVRLELRHARPTPPASMGISDDQRLIAYRLERISC